MKSVSIRRLGACLVILIPAASCFGQPSGGPYGPIQQKYPLPDVAGRIFFAAPDGMADASGEGVDQPTTIESAIARVTTGDAIVLRGGVYRTGGLRLNQGVVIQPYQDERPVLKGTRVAKQWQPVSGGLWRTRWETLFPLPPQPWWRREREATRTPIYRFNNDMVFVDGRMLSAVGWAGEVDESSYWIDYEQGYIYIGVNPAGRDIEITAHDCGLLRTTGEAHGKRPDDKGLTVRGVTFTQYAYRAIEIEGIDPEGVSPEDQHGKDVVGSTFEHCTFSYCSRVAGYFRGDHLTIRHCLVSDTSTEGIFILASNDVLLEKNVITRNDMERITGYYVSAVKIFNQCHRVTCRDNLIIDNPTSSGVWYDVGEVDGVFVNNWVQNTDNGFFFEISQNAICAGNVFVDCLTGVHVLNSRGVRISHNTFINSRLLIGRTSRSAVGDHFGWHPATGPDVEQREDHSVTANLLAAEEGFRGPMLQLEQSPDLRGRLQRTQVTELDQNLYIRQANPARDPLIEISPAANEEGRERFATAADLHAKHRAYAGASHSLADYYGPLFTGRRLARFELVAGAPSLPAPLPVPPVEVAEQLGWPADAAPTVGAYPVR